MSSPQSGPRGWRQPRDAGAFSSPSRPLFGRMAEERWAPLFLRPRPQSWGQALSQLGPQLKIPRRRGEKRGEERQLRTGLRPRWLLWDGLIIRVECLGLGAAKNSCPPARHEEPEGGFPHPNCRWDFPRACPKSPRRWSIDTVLAIAPCQEPPPQPSWAALLSPHPCNPTAGSEGPGTPPVPHPHSTYRPLPAGRQAGIELLALLACLGELPAPRILCPCALGRGALQPGTLLLQLSQAQLQHPALVGSPLPAAPQHPQSLRTPQQHGHRDRHRRHQHQQPHAQPQHLQRGFGHRGVHAGEGGTGTLVAAWGVPGLLRVLPVGFFSAQLRFGLWFLAGHSPSRAWFAQRVGGCSAPASAVGKFGRDKPTPCQEGAGLMLEQQNTLGFHEFLLENSSNPPNCAVSVNPLRKSSPGAVPGLHPLLPPPHLTLPIAHFAERLPRVSPRDVPMVGELPPPASTQRDGNRPPLPRGAGYKPGPCSRGSVLNAAASPPRAEPGGRAARPRRGTSRWCHSNASSVRTRSLPKRPRSVTGDRAWGGQRESGDSARGWGHRGGEQGGAGVSPVLLRLLQLLPLLFQLLLDLPVVL